MNDENNVDDSLNESGEQYESMTSWKNEPTVRDLKQDFLDSESDHSVNENNIRRWLDHFHMEGEAKINTPKGKSNIQPKLIRKQAEWRYATLSEPFLSSPDIFNISPATHLDVDAARQNELILNNQFNTKLNKVKLIDEYVRTAVSEGTVIARVGWNFQEEEREVQTPEYETYLDPSVVTQQRLQQLTQLLQTDALRYGREVPDGIKLAHAKSIQDGIPYGVRVKGYKITTEKVTTANHPTVDICHYTNVRIDPTCNGDAEKANFIIFSFETSLSDLEKDGKYTNLDKIMVEENDINSTSDHSRPEGTSFNFKDKPRKRFTAYEYWGYWDIDDSGTTKPIVATYVGNVMIRLEESPYPDQGLPFVVVQYLPKKRSVHGEPDGELLIDNQKVIGAVARGMVDTMARSANGQIGYRKDALDIVNKRKLKLGDDFEYNNTDAPSNLFHTFTYPELPQSASVMLQYMNQEAEALTGTRAFGATNTDGIGDTATHAKSAMDAASIREVGILRRLSEGMVQIARKIIAMNAEFLSEEEVVRITDQEFEPIKRDDLAGNFDISLSISTAEEDNAKAQELAFMLQTLGNKVDPAITFKVMSKIARLRKMPELANDLENYQPKPDPMQQQLQQLEIQKLQMEIAEIQSRTVENRTDAQLNLAKAGTEQAKAGNLASDTDLKDLDYLEQESGAKHARDLQKQSQQGKMNMALAALNAGLDKENPTVGASAPTKVESAVGDPTVSNGLTQQ